MRQKLSEIIYQSARKTCYECLRPASHCLCSFCRPFIAHTNFLILQHPNERKKYYSTAKLVNRCIKNSRLLRGVEFDQSFLETIVCSSKHFLLYPASDSTDCQDILLSLEDSVVVLDGTWSEAGKILYRNPVLQRLPKISFNLELRSNYRIRKQPKDNYLSTLESIGHLLKLNLKSFTMDNQNKLSDYQHLFDLFDTMVEKQLGSYRQDRLY